MHETLRCNNWRRHPLVWCMHPSFPKLYRVVDQPTVRTRSVTSSAVRYVWTHFRTEWCDALCTVCLSPPHTLLCVSTPACSIGCQVLLTISSGHSHSQAPGQLFQCWECKCSDRGSDVDWCGHDLAQFVAKPMDMWDTCVVEVKAIMCAMWAAQCCVCYRVSCLSCVSVQATKHPSSQG